MSCDLNPNANGKGGFLQRDVLNHFRGGCSLLEAMARSGRSPKAAEGLGLLLEGGTSFDHL